MPSLRLRPVRAHGSRGQRLGGALLVASLLVLAACGSAQDSETHLQGGTASPHSPAPASRTQPSPSGSTTPSPQTPVPPPRRTQPSLVGDRANAWAFAPIDAPLEVVVEGEVRRQRAWSTSKVLIAAAFIAEVAAGDPTRLSVEQDGWVRRAMDASDLDSLLEMRRAIGGDRQAKLQAILTGVGDDTTEVPTEKEGTMEWAVEDQVLFMAALARGEVVSAAASAYLLEAMQPIDSQRWGLATIGARAVKGGWLTPTTETRQMGIVGEYAVAIITDAVGPAVLQSDGDDAHVEQMNRLAALLEERLSPAP